MDMHLTFDNVSKAIHVPAIQDFVGFFSLLTRLHCEPSVKFPTKSFAVALILCKISK